MSPTATTTGAIIIGDAPATYYCSNATHPTAITTASSATSTATSSGIYTSPTATM